MSTSNDELIFFVGLAVLFAVVVATAASLATHHATKNSFHTEAVRVGAAEYVAGKDGESVWRWKKSDQTKELSQ